jgi:hypothetical protein
MFKKVIIISAILLLAGCKESESSIEQYVRHIIKVNLGTEMAIKLPVKRAAYVVIRENQSPMVLTFKKPSLIGTPNLNLRMQTVNFDDCNTVVSDALNKMLNDNFGKYTPCSISGIDSLLILLKNGDIRLIKVSESLTENSMYARFKAEDLQTDILIYRSIDVSSPIITAAKE